MGIESCDWWKATPAINESIYERNSELFPGAPLLQNEQLFHVKH